MLCYFLDIVQIFRTIDLDYVLMLVLFILLSIIMVGTSFDCRE